MTIDQATAPGTHKPVSTFRPPAPIPLTPLRSLLRVIRQGDGDLLSLVPREAYCEPMTWLGYSRRSILLINDPDVCRDVLADSQSIFPKNDLMVGALEALVGDSIFVSHGERWKRQRRMIDPAFSQLRIHRAFDSMSEAVAACEQRLDASALSSGPSAGPSSGLASDAGTDTARDTASDSSSETLSLDLIMSELTADVICRTIFSESLDSHVAREVFADFMIFERGVASVNLRQLIFGKPWASIRQPSDVTDACRRIRAHIGELLDPRLAANAPARDDIVQAVIEARDQDTGERFTREELIDQIGVFFLAGHETTASVLTWVFYMVGTRPDLATRLRAEIDQVVGDAPVGFEHLKRLGTLRNVFRETLRLYPPITFIPRVANEATTIGGTRVKRGAMIMISPWTAHRNASLWPNADRFDPDRFDPDRLDTAAAADDADRRGILMSFGVGPRVCIGASFATTEAVLIMARLIRRYSFEIEAADAVRPAARLTTRPAHEIRCRIRRNPREHVA